MRKEEALELPMDLDYDAVGGLSAEDREKLKDHRPATLAAEIRSPRVLSLSSSALGENSYSLFVDPKLGVHVIDRFTHHVLAFFEALTPESESTMGELVASLTRFPPEALGASFEEDPRNAGDGNDRQALRDRVEVTWGAARVYLYHRRTGPSATQGASADQP